MTDINAKKEKKSSPQTISKLDSKTTPNIKGGLFSDPLMPRGLEKMDENTGLNPSWLEKGCNSQNCAGENPWGRKGQVRLGHLWGPELTNPSGALVQRGKQRLWSEPGG